jgi:hypothetical protein
MKMRLKEDYLRGRLVYGVGSQALPRPEAPCRSGSGDALVYGPWLVCSLSSQMNPRQVFKWSSSNRAGYLQQNELLLYMESLG